MAPRTHSETGISNQLEIVKEHRADAMLLCIYIRRNVFALSYVLVNCIVFLASFLNQQKLIRGQKRNSGKAFLRSLLQQRGAKTNYRFPCLLAPQGGAQHPTSAPDPLLLLQALQKWQLGTSLVVPWWKVSLPMQETQVGFLIQEDPTRCRATKSLCHNSSPVL